jgi:putative transposase
LSWTGLKKNLGLNTEQKKALIEPGHPELSIRKQCDLLGLNRSSFYYQPVGVGDYTLLLMRLIDEQYTRTPFFGVPKMTGWLHRRGHHVNRKRVRRLMRLLGLEAIYPKPKLSQPNLQHKVYPYLLRGVRITRVNQVWGTDITYVRLYHGFIYLTAIMDWFSRFVLAWAISNTLEVDFCIDALERALRQGIPEIFNSDQGAQFTSPRFTAILLNKEIAISMDGRGRVLDNIFVERLWRSVKYEEVYIHDYQSVAEARQGIKRYFQLYNYERPHQSLNYKTPAEVFFRPA